MQLNLSGLLLTTGELIQRRHYTALGQAERKRSNTGSEVNMHQLHVPFPVERSHPGQQTPPRPVEKPKRRISEARRAYLRRYYEANKEKAREYQRRYNLMHKKKARLADSYAGTNRLREAVRETYHASDIMQAPTEKSMKILQLILRGERSFTM